MNESLSAVDGIEYGSKQAVAKTLNISFKAAKCLIYNTVDQKRFYWIWTKSWEIH